jgi:O-methyltransferase
MDGAGRAAAAPREGEARNGAGPGGAGDERSDVDHGRLSSLGPVAAPNGTAPVGPPSKFRPERLRALRHPIDLVGRLLIARQLESSLRFKSSERFGYEIAHRRDFFRHAFHYLRFNGIDGDYAEFGSHGAYTFRLAWGASELLGQPCHLWAFDSFEGLPGADDARDDHPQWQAGTMATALPEFQRLCRKAGIPQDRYSAVAGYYSSTLAPEAAGRRPDRVSFAYVDCDLFSSTEPVLDFLETRLRPGSIIAFDDYYCYAPDGPSGERLAAREHFAGSQWTLVPYIQYGWAGMSFVVEQRDAAHPVSASW